jgi:hypothetical protein
LPSTDTAKASEQKTKQQERRKPMKKLLKTASLLAFLVAAPTIAQAFPINEILVDRYVRATQAALCGPTWNKAPLNASNKTHWFNVKLAQYHPSSDGSKLWITGQLSHRLTWRPDDQIYYTIKYEKDNNGLWKLKDPKTDVQLRVNRGGWGALLGPIWTLVNAFVFTESGKTIPVTPEMVNKNTSDAAALVGGNWEDCVQILVSDIAGAGSNPHYCSIVSGLVEVFEEPLVDGFRLDVCRLWSTDCGQPAADAFCASQGYTSANAWDIDYGIGAETPTKILETGEICDQSYCDGFRFIQCQ